MKAIRHPRGRLERYYMACESFAAQHNSVGAGYQNRPRQALKTRSSQGQVIVELVFVLPLLLLLGLGVIDMSYLLFNQHIITRLTREGSNLISRDVTLSDAGTAMRSMVNPPVDLNGSNSKLIFTVLTKWGSGSNNNYDVIYKRYEIGGLAASSAFTTQGPISSASFDSTNDYRAINPDNNINLRVTNVPASLVLTQSQYVYVTEIYTRHVTITPLASFGMTPPATLYSVAYF
jgi:hypothetical protein